MTSEQPPNETSQGEEAYARLLSEIRHGRLAPGERITETQLAAQLSISRTPVREAIKRLEADGLVAHVPRVGAAIRKLDYAEVTELYEMRAVLEGAAARFAARGAYEAEVDELEAINAEMAAATNDVDRLYEANRQFHEILRNAARNRFLNRAVESVEKTLLVLGPSTMEEADRAEAAVEEHAAIIAALRTQNGEAAEAMMRRHIEAAHRARLKQLRERGSE